jgi:hypothetical protein
MTSNTSPFASFNTKGNTFQGGILQNNPKPSQSELFAANVPTTSHFHPATNGVFSSQQPTSSFLSGINGLSQHSGAMGGQQVNTCQQQVNQQSHDIFGKSLQSKNNQGLLGFNAQQSHGKVPFAPTKSM